MKIMLTICKEKTPVYLKGRQYSHFQSENVRKRLNGQDEEIQGTRDILVPSGYAFPAGTALSGSITDEYEFLCRPEFNAEHSEWMQYYGKCVISGMVVEGLPDEGHTIRYSLYNRLRGIMSNAMATYFLDTFSPVILEDRLRNNRYWFHCRNHGLTDENFVQINRTQTIDTFELRLEQLRACTAYFLSLNERNGNTWMTLDGLYNNICWRMRQDGHLPPSRDLLISVLNYNGDFYFDEKEGRVAFESTWRTEANIWQDCNILLCNRPLFPDTVTFDGTLCPEQEAAVTGLTGEGGLTILTGGPGTGKTTCISEILKQYHDKRVCLLAPTGRAVQRMRESLSDVLDAELIDSYKISTICKFLGYGMPKYLKLEAVREAAVYNLCIVDESSMVDIFQFSELLKALDLNTCKVILVGDKDQLPSIHAGNVLTDLIDMGVPTYYLTENHRSSRSIHDNARRMLLYSASHWNLPSGGTSFTFIQDEYNALLDCSQLEHVLNTVDFSAPDTLFLSPYRKPYSRTGAAMTGNTTDINIRIHNRLFGDGADYQHPNYLTGDKVIFTKNNYNAGYFNGEIGYVSRITENSIFVRTGDGRTVEVRNPRELDYAYAISIHKGQGSEADNVYIYIPDDLENPDRGNILTRNLLYTAFTRARKKAVLIGNVDSLLRVLKNTAGNRQTFLSLPDKLKEAAYAC